jgi:hypothetical protein
MKLSTIKKANDIFLVSTKGWRIVHGTRGTLEPLLATLRTRSTLQGWQGDSGVGRGRRPQRRGREATLETLKPRSPKPKSGSVVAELLIRLRDSNLARFAQLAQRAT